MFTRLREIEIILRDLNFRNYLIFLKFTARCIGVCRTKNVKSLWWSFCAEIINGFFHKKSSTEGPKYSTEKMLGNMLLFLCEKKDRVTPLIGVVSWLLTFSLVWVLAVCSLQEKRVATIIFPKIFSVADFKTWTNFNRVIVLSSLVVNLFYFKRWLKIIFRTVCCW